VPQNLLALPQRRDLAWTLIQAEPNRRAAGNRHRAHRRAEVESLAVNLVPGSGHLFRSRSPIERATASWAEGRSVVDTTAASMSPGWTPALVLRNVLAFAANMLQVYGVLYWGWDIFQILDYDSPSRFCCAPTRSLSDAALTTTRKRKGGTP